jgi:nudix-type nucleoside diphosphatase (YffH/AdpP family)
MPKRVDILNEQIVFEKYIFQIQEAELQHEQYDGEMSPSIKRLNFVRGDSVAAIVHNPADDTILLTEQFRYPTHTKGTSWLQELPAGTIDAGEEPHIALTREIIEETGYQLQAMRHIHTFFVSPGGTSERIFLYYTQIDPSAGVQAGGGIGDEDIKTLTLTVDAALAGLARGDFTDAKTIIALQWLAAHRDQLMMD